MRIVYRFSLVLLISMYLLGCGEKTSSIEGKFIDATGKPLAGISVIFKQVQPTQGYEQFETKTGPDGVFRLSGCAPQSEYIISTLSDKWKSRVTKKVKTLEAGQNLVLTQPIKIRFTQLKDGSVIDTKTGMQWKIYPVKDMSAETVLEKVKSLSEGGFTDWRLPSRADLSSLQEDKPAPKTPAEAASVTKTCCAWVSEPDSKDVDWKFYVEEDNELWSSNKDTPDNRIIIVRTYSSAPAQVAVKPADTIPSATPAPAPAAAPATAVSPQLPGQTPSKTQVQVRYASRKACAEKKAQAAKAEQAAAAVKPAPAPAPAPSVAKVAPAAPKTTVAKVAPSAPAPAPAVSAPKTKPAVVATPKSQPTSVASAPKAPVKTNAMPTKSDNAKVVSQEQVKKTEVAKAAPVKTATAPKKAAPAKKKAQVKVADQDVSAEKGVTLYYESGSSNLSPKELLKLKTFFSKIKNNKGTIVINGHSDASSNGEATGNVMLSNNRSSSVLQALHKMGLSRQIKLEMGALGDSKPAASNDTPEGRKLNRRVEVNFTRD